MTNTSSVIMRILASAGLCLVLCRSSAAGEFRGLWVDAFGPGFFNAGQVKKLAADCRKYNFNAVIVEMRRRGDSFYRSNYDPRTTIITTNFDALAEIVKECHSGTPRIEVHCWVVSHFIWAWDRPPSQPGHVVNRHPEYLTRDSIGQKLIGKGYFLDPGNPDANQTIYNVAKDIVSRYDIDGFHWDYCRYPVQDSGYNDTAIRRFNQEFGLTGQPSPKDPKFSEWRRRQVTDFLRWVDADLWEIKPNLVISASVFGNIKDSYDYRFADWPAWTKEGIVDVCMPMEFSPDNKKTFCPRVDDAFTNRGNQFVYIGQAAYMNTKENTLAQLEYAREKGFPGTVLYSYRNPNSGKVDQDQVFAYLKERYQPMWTNTPALTWKKTKAILKGTVVQGDGHAPVYNALVTLSSEPPRTHQTEPHGKYAFFDLNPGAYRIAAEVNGSAVAPTDIKVEAGSIVTVNLELKTATAR